MSARGQMRELTVSLDDAGMTALHRVGVAGLWMTLKAFDEERSLGEEVRAEGSWELGSRSVSLSWTGDATRFFQALVKCSFKVDSNGLAHFPALGPPTAHPAAAVVLQEALLGTFLQHGQTRKAGPPGSGSLGVSEEDEQDTGPVTFRRLTHYIHMDARIDLGKNTALAGWNFPGGAVRHTSFVNDTALEEPPGRYLALLYAPVAAYYFVLAPRNRGKQGRYCLVLPELDDLAKYAKGRAEFEKVPARSFRAAGGAEAALRVTSHLAAQQLLENLGVFRCQVVEFGTVPWSSQQKTRIRLFDLNSVPDNRLAVFRLAEQMKDFQPTLRTAANGSKFWSVAQTPELIARNIIVGTPWWRGFAEFANTQEKPNMFFATEGKGLAQMVSEQAGGLVNNPEEVFVKACHEAWRRRLGSLGQRAKDPSRPTSFDGLARRDFTKLRVGLSHAKNSATFRQQITDFWSRGGSIGALADGWTSILPFLGPRWQEGRDLALLALASYQPKSKEEAQALGGVENEPEIESEDKAR